MRPLLCYDSSRLVQIVQSVMVGVPITAVISSSSSKQFLDKCSSHCVPFGRRQAQDARHHGQYEPEGQLRGESVAALVADYGCFFLFWCTSRCVPTSATWPVRTWTVHAARPLPSSTSATAVVCPWLGLLVDAVRAVFPSLSAGPSAGLMVQLTDITVGGRVVILVVLASLVAPRWTSLRTTVTVFRLLRGTLLVIGATTICRLLGTLAEELRKIGKCGR